MHFQQRVFALPSGATTPVRHHASDTAFFRSLRETWRVFPSASWRNSYARF